jgi:hypothetical protein
MFRRLLYISGSLVLMSGASLFGATGTAHAATTTFSLTLPYSAFSSIMPYEPGVCTYPQQLVTTEGFDPATGFPEANVELYEGCGPKGGTYEKTAYTGAIWDDSGYFYSLIPLSTNPPVTTAFDSYGNEETGSYPYAYFSWAAGFVPVPRVVSLSPVSGSIYGGETETVTGSGFTNATTVDFGSVQVPFTVVNDNTITLTTPADPSGGPGTVDVTVASTAGTSTTSGADQFTYTLPQVTGIDTTVGPSSGGTTIMISGVGFLGATGVDVGAVPVASYTVVNDTTITAVTQADTAIADDATVDVSVISPAGSGPTSTADQYTYVVPPRITSISPSSVPLEGGVTLTISGADLAYGSVLKIAEQQVPFTYDSSGSIIAAAPSHDAYESVAVSFTTVGGTSAPGGAATLKYVQGTPTITLYPTSGPAGTTISASGLNFVPGEKLTVTYATSVSTSSGAVVLCKATASSTGSFGCAGVLASAKYGKKGNHLVTVTGKHGTKTDKATAVFTLT